MSKQSFTPGPWRVSTENDLVFGAVQGNGLEPIGFVYGPSHHGDREAADARLIAAAPDMLASLVVVRRSAGWPYMSAETHALIETAIAKATRP